MCVAALGIVTAVLGAVGQFMQFKAQAAQAKYQAAVDRNNAIIATRFAKDSRARGDEAEAQVRIRNAAFLGRQRSVFGARNIDMSSGSALDILGDTAALGELDALTTKNNFEREAIGFESQSMNFRASASLNDMKANNLMTSGIFAAFTTALGGVQNAFG